MLDNQCLTTGSPLVYSFTYIQIRGDFCKCQKSFRGYRMTLKQNPYQVLGISVAATENQIRAAYQKKAALAHPDRGGDSDDFMLIRQSYECLIDETSRKIWDDEHAVTRVSKEEREAVCREMLTAWLHGEGALTR